MVCQYCNKECKNQNSLKNHERLCKLNPNRQESPFVKYNMKHGAWNKGLTKDTDTRVSKQCKTYKDHLVSKVIDAPFKGKHHSIETKKMLSDRRIDYLNANPDKVPYLLNHSSKTSYPEQYFIELFAKENIELDYHKRVGLYQLDFYNDDKMVYVEIDGEQHYNDKRIVASDMKRDVYLANLGWKGFRIRWTDYQKLSLNERKDFINNIKHLLD